MARLSSQVYGIISTSPWAMKALIGTVSDAVPLFGWHKVSWPAISRIANASQSGVNCTGNLLKKCSQGLAATCVRCACACLCQRARGARTHTERIHTHGIRGRHGSSSGDPVSGATTLALTRMQKHMRRRRARAKPRARQIDADSPHVPS